MEKERARPFDEVKDMKEEAEEANSVVDEALATKKLSEPQAGSNSAKGEELDTKENSSESLNHESQQEKELEHQLAEKNDASPDKLKMEVVHQKTSEPQPTGSLSDCQKRIHELEDELDKRKESEANLFDSLVMQTKQLEQSKILLEESKLENASLRGKVEALQSSAAHNKKIPDESQDGPSTVKTEDEQVENKLTGAKEVGKLASLFNAESMLAEVNLLKNELKLATEAEENSKKAMDDLALALKEVATEANQAKEKLSLSQVELEHSKEEAERLRVMLKTTKDKYKELLEETKKEAERHKNTAERLRLEAEESLLAWNVKETEFVNCIKKAEDERSAAQQESTRLHELLAVAENKNQVSKDENQKLRDILKQALNEANVAKEAAGIARAENSQLQDSLAGKEQALNLLAQENELLKTREAEALEKIKELKRSSLSESSAKELKNEETEKLPTKEAANKEDKELERKANVHNATDKEQKVGSRHVKSFSLNLKDLKISHKHNDEEDEEEILIEEALKGSIFDESACTPNKAAIHNRELMHSVDFDNLDESHLDDMDHERNSRKRRALLRRFGDLIIRRRTYHHRRESSHDQESLNNVT